MRTPRSDVGQSLTLTGYRSVLPKITWSQATYNSSGDIMPFQELRVSTPMHPHLSRSLYVYRVYQQTQLQWCMRGLNLTLKFKYSTLHWYQIRDIFSIYIPTRELYQFAKMIILFRVGTPHGCVFEKWTQWCMIDSNLTPKVKYSMILCSLTRDVFSIYIYQLES